MRPAILIHGPTASGKTALAIALAQRVNGEIVNADAMQVYSGLRVLTARPTEAEAAQARHHLFGHVDPAERYSTGRWLAEATACIRDIRGRGKTPVVVGGTGLYLHVLTSGLAEIPPIPDDVREQARNLVRNDEPAARARLEQVDPQAAARISPGDRQRLARALEVWMATGRALSDYQGASEPPLAAGDWLGVALTPQRAALYARIDRRVDDMVARGAVEEAQALHARGLDRELPAMRAHGMPGFADHFDGATDLAAALDRCRRDTRRYAKRQLTWIAHQFTMWPRIPAESENTRLRVILSMFGEIDRLQTTS